MKKTVLIITFAMIPAVLYSGSAVDISGQIRHRYEFSDKDFNSATNAESFSLLRTRLNLGLAPTGNVKAFIQFQDARNFGEEGNTLTDGSADNFDLHQGFIFIHRFFDLPLDVKLGRYEVVYGPERLLGSVGWSNTGRSLDGLTVSLHHPIANIEFLNLKAGRTNTAGDAEEVWVRGFYGNLNLENYATHTFFIQDDKRNTWGMYAKGDIFQNLSHETGFAIQGGSVGGLNQKGLFYATNLTYDQGMFKLTGGYEHLSGDDPATPDKNETFNTLYATNHKFYGFMDYFPSGSGDLGLNDLYVKFSPGKIKGVKIDGVYHVFTSEFKSNEKTDFGNELDITCTKKYDDSLTFIGGYSMFFKGSADVGSYTDTSDASWFYFMTLVNF